MTELTDKEARELEVADSERRELLSQVERADAENRALRRLLAVRVSGASLYTDDGELQDNSQRPFIDYHLDSPADIQRKLQERAVPAEPLEDQRCPHGTRYPHPCRECEDAWLKPGWSRAEHAKPAAAEPPQITREQWEDATRGLGTKA